MSCLTGAGPKHMGPQFWRIVMGKMTRKSFLHLAAAATASAAFGSQASAQSRSAVAPRLSGSTGPLLIRGADLLTMDPVLQEIEGGDVLVENGKISAVGQGLALDGAEVIDARGMILMPGMCDGHRHVWQIIDAGRLAKTRPAHYATYQNWKMRTIVSLTPEDHYLAGLVGGLLAIDSGVTSIIDYAHGQINAETALAAGQGVKDSGIGGWFAFQLGVSSSYKPGDTVPLAVATSQRIAKSTERPIGQPRKGCREKYSLTVPAPCNWGSRRLPGTEVRSRTSRRNGPESGAWACVCSQPIFTSLNIPRHRASWDTGIPGFPISTTRDSWGRTTTALTPTGLPPRSSVCCGTPAAWCVRQPWENFPMWSRLTAARQCTRGREPRVWPPESASTSTSY